MRVAIFERVNGACQLYRKIAERRLAEVRARFADFAVIARAKADHSGFAQRVAIRNVDGPPTSLRVVGAAIPELDRLHFAHRHVQPHRLCAVRGPRRCSRG